jgi:hypothetical protein
MPDLRFDGVYQRASQDGSYHAYLRFFANGATSTASISGPGAKTPGDVATKLSSLPPSSDCWAVSGNSVSFMATTESGAIAYTGEVSDDRLELRWHSFINGNDASGTYVFVPATAPAAGWMADPFGRHQHRYWDGAQWTAHIANNGTASTDPPSSAKASAPTPAVTTPSSSAATPTAEPGASSAPAGERADTATRTLVLHMINEAHRGTPLENQEVVDLLEGFQRAAGLPTGTSGSVAFMSALKGDTQQELCARPWRWLLSVARQASSAHDDLFVAHVLFWTFAWKSAAEQRFRPLLGIHLVGSIPGDVLGDLKRLAEQSLPRLPHDQVLFGDQSGQVTVGHVASAVQATFS